MVTPVHGPTELQQRDSFTERSNVANAALKVPIKLLGACRPAVFVNVWNARKKIYSD